MLVSFRKQAWQDYLYWFRNDRKNCQRIHELVKSSQRTPFDGIGKPEALKLMSCIFQMHVRSPETTPA